MIFLLILCGIIIILPFLYTTVFVRYEKSLAVDIRFGLFTLCLTRLNENGKGEKEPMNIFGIIKNVLAALDMTSVSINKLWVRIPAASESYLPFTLPFGYSVALGTLLAYIEERSASLTVADDAFIIDPDSEQIAYIDVSFKTRLYNVVLTYIRILRDKKRADARKEKANVGN